MATVLITFCVFLFVISAMAIGVIFANKPLKGSCGGLSNLGLKDGCFICGGKDSKNPLKKVSDKQINDLAYDATKS
ncbi:MAG: (Na+)-NQR maturation NqrM [Endozoicomonas sp. (ex Botrylloides leachii)]|nr:(Na+)-NQR maturation NqrM [Endozoicomonas sp. (ex Botrylloides leachii)]